MRFRRRSLLQGAAAAPLAAQTGTAALVLPANLERSWISGDFWANPLQDWRLADGRIECVVSGGDRNLSLLTRELGEEFSATVELGPLDSASSSGEGFAGLRFGLQGYWKDYRDTALRGAGTDAGITTDGRLFLGVPEPSSPRVSIPSTGLTMRLTVRGGYAELAALGTDGVSLGSVRRLAGGTGLLALVCHAGPVTATPPRRNIARQGNVRFWFRGLTVEGPTVRHRPERAFGPILFPLFTLSGGTLKLSVQCAPLESGSHTVEFQLRQGRGWRTVASAPVDAMSATALIRIDNWTRGAAAPYRLALRHDGRLHTLEGTIPADPISKPKLRIGALTCQNDIGFPHAPIARNLTHLQPDILFFTGDQIYERSGDYGNQMEPPPAARLDYLRKWFLFGWSWGHLTRNIPCVCLPDDHDVYHGNLWGCAGRRAERGATAQEWQDSGGYKMPADWVNMVQRTQTAHLPDPPDPTPVEQGITVHYCHLRWGGISFAVLEDRKWKSAPKEKMPGARIVNGWPQNTQWKAATEGNVADAELLGPRQEKFLEDWARDWSGGTFLKAVVSATIFCNLATLPPPATTDAVTGKLPIGPIGSYPEGEMKTMDHDSNAWPQQKRNRALRAMRKALAFHIAGDQHLASTSQYGIDDWNDAAYYLCTPAISNIFPRRWYPAQPGRNPLPHAPRNTGEFTDAFGNRVTVHAVANPAQFGAEPPELYNRAVGFGVVDIDRATREITFTNWPAWVDVADPSAKPYPGWPVRLRQTDNGLPNAKWRLAPVDGGQILAVSTPAGELLYKFRLPSGRFTPPVPAPGPYVVELTHPHTGATRKLPPQEAVTG